VLQGYSKDDDDKCKYDSYQTDNYKKFLFDNYYRLYDTLKDENGYTTYKFSGYKLQTFLKNKSNIIEQYKNDILVKGKLEILSEIIKYHFDNCISDTESILIKNTKNNKTKKLLDIKSTIINPLFYTNNGNNGNNGGKRKSKSRKQNKGGKKIKKTRKHR
jgi:hypothetical protein